MTQAIETFTAAREANRPRPARPGPLAATTQTSTIGAKITAAGGWLRARRRSVAWFVPLFLLSALVQLVNMTGSPQRIDDEGTYTAQAWAIEKLHEITHYTYWYDHPPLGWLQIAGYTSLTGAFSRYDVAVMAGRESMVFFHLISLVLLWMLGRRLGLARPTTAAAVAVYAFSPLAVQFHRTVFLDNVATPWLLAAFVLVLAPRRQLAAFAGAALCFAVAVLSKETVLLFMPFLAWMMWRNAHRETRRYTVSLAAAIVVLLGFSYVLLALIKGELLPGSDRVSLFSGITFQLGGRAASGSLFDAGSQARVTLGQWLQLDTLICILAPVAGLICLLDKRIRPIAAALVALVIFMLRPGYLPIPYVIGLLPLAALVIPGAVQLIIVRARRSPSQARRGLGVVAGTLAALIMVGAAAPAWGPQLRGLVLSDLDQPMRQATAWVDTNVPHDYRLVVDDSMWTDFVEAGFPRENVVWYYKVDTDPAVAAKAPNGWSDYDYVITTNSMRTFPDGFPIVKQALDNSVVVARFGTGDKAVEVNRVMRQGQQAADAAGAADLAARQSFGQQLVANPDLRIPTPVRDLITGGRLDARALILLPRLASIGTITVTDLPALDGEASTDLPRRQVLIAEVDGRAPTLAQEQAIADTVTAQSSRYAAQSALVTDQGVLITWDASAPTGLLPAVGSGS